MKEAPLIGRTLSHYKVLDEISRGGMGIVYRALDVKLNRDVALKVLPPDLLTNPERKRRFVREAQAAASLEHPHIAVVHEIDESDGVTFIAMELIRGEKLSDMLARGKLSGERALELAIEIAEGLASAHGKGIVHRDLKPDNVMITADGHVKLIDFGLAKLLEARAPESMDSDIGTAVRHETEAGVIMGTLSHMSPEQARGQGTDHRTDIFSFGILLHEMLSGDVPFTGPSSAEVQYAIIHEPAPRLARERTGFQSVVDRCLEKNPDDRFEAMTELLDELRKLRQQVVRASASIQSTLRKPGVRVATALLLVLAGWFVVRSMRESGRSRWVREEAIPEIERLVAADNYASAFHLAREAERLLPNESVWESLWPRMTAPLTIETEPRGADVYLRTFPEGSGAEIHLGVSPIVGENVPLGMFWLRVEKDGFAEVDSLMPPPEYFPTQTIHLEALETAPAGMVSAVPPRLVIRMAGYETEERYDGTPYWIDEYEVTNRAYKRFVDDGGYDTPELWKHDIIEGETVVSFDASRALFRDRTGRPGPSTWSGGTYDEGMDEYPVSGVSWYEAAAYAEFAGRSLPTIYHWSSAAATRFPREVLSFSNFDAEGPEPGDSRPPSVFGARHMAGNVKEWCWNEASGRRYILGGAWDESAYLFYEPDLRDPLDRSRQNGFRTVLYSETSSKDLEAMSRPIELPAPRAETEPVPDPLFEAYKALYSYDSTELDAVVESIDDSSQYWTVEKVSYAAAYGDERISAYLFLPKNVAPPFQTILFFPGSNAVGTRSSANIVGLRFLDFLVKSGRAVMYPVYKGTYERPVADLQFTDANPTSAYAELATQWVQDAMRSVDYLESHPEIDTDRLGYNGVSWGARLGNLVLAVDDRLKAAVLLYGGFPDVQPRPEVAESNFAPRVRAPVLMINGSHDAIFPLETNQKPMFELLGSRIKEHAVYEGGHGLTGYYNQTQKQILEWFDEHLGLVDSSRDLAR